MYAVLPIVDQHGQHLAKKKSLLILTNDFIIYYNLYNFFDQEQQKMISKSLLMFEKLKNIVNYSLWETQDLRGTNTASDANKKDSETT